MKPPPPLCVELRRSRLALAAVVAMHAATAALLLALPLPPEVRAAGGLGVALAGALALRSIAGPARLTLGLDRSLAVTRRDGRTRAGEVLGSSYVGAWLTTIVWRPDGARFARALIVVPDVMPAEDFRRLRVALRYGMPATPVVA